MADVVTSRVESRRESKSACKIMYIKIAGPLRECWESDQGECPRLYIFQSLSSTNRRRRRRERFLGAVLPSSQVKRLDAFVDTEFSDYGCRRVHEQLPFDLCALSAPAS